MNNDQICQNCEKYPCKWSEGTEKECTGYREKEDVE